MGLDQNLYLYKYSDAADILNAQDEGTEVPEFKPAAEQYFRKFNALQDYVESFVEDSDINCKYVALDIEELFDALFDTSSGSTKLRSQDEIKKNFEPTEGFFFGSTEYDEWYWEDVDTLAEWVKDAHSKSQNDALSVLYYCWY